MKRISFLFRRPIKGLIALLLAVMNSMMMPLLAIIMQTITNELIDNRNVNKKLVCLCIGFSAGAFFVSVFYVYIKDELINSIIKDEKYKVFNEIFQKNNFEFRSNNTSTYISLLNHDIYIIESEFFETLFSVFGASITVALSFFIIWKIHHKMLFLMICIVLGCMILPNTMGIRMGKYKNDYLESFKKFNGIIKDYFNAFEVIKSYNVFENIKNSFNDYNERLEKKRLKSKMFEDIILLLSNFSAYGLGITMFLVCAYYVNKGVLRAGDMIAVVQLSNSIMSPIMMIMISIGHVIAAINVWTRIDKTVGHETHNEKSLVSKKDTSESSDDVIHIRNICFGYPNGTGEALHNVSITFEKGKKYAIVGRSGSGKTTLIKLLLHYYNNYSGDIVLDNCEYRSIEDSVVYESITYMQQHGILFNDTLKYNLTLGRDISCELINHAIDKANLRGTVDKLNHGLDTIISENGDNLSGGERKRIEICRALLKNANIFIIDEFSSGLDVSTANAIEKELLQLDSTIINVTHSAEKEILQLYDSIIVVDNGTICEVGTYLDLFKYGTVFYSIVGGTYNDRKVS